MAKLKVGDRVGYYGSESKFYRMRGKVSDVTTVKGALFVTVDLDNGEELGAPEKDWTFMNAVRSTNAVVQMALNACKNAAGDFIQYTADSYDYIPKVGEEYKYDGRKVKCTSVIRLAGDRYLIEGRALNALAARNAAGVRSGNYEVTLETVTLKGNTTTTVSMTDAQLKSWLGLIHCGGLYTEATARFAKGEKYYDANVDMHPTVHIKPIL